jgi:hypothetical protein
MSLPNSLTQLQLVFESELPSLETLKEYQSSDPQAKELAHQYLDLYQESLDTYSKIGNYASKHITNLMVISARGYVPLLEFKRKQLNRLIVNIPDIHGKTALNYVRNSQYDDQLKANIIEILENVTKISDLHKDHLWQILLNTDPEDLNSLCRSSYENTRICKEPYFKKEYLARNANKLRSRLLFLPPTQANKYCSIELYQSVCSDPEFIQNYNNLWKSEFFGNGYTSDLDPNEHIVYEINTLPIVDGQVMVNKVVVIPEVGDPYADDKDYREETEETVPLSITDLDKIVFPINMFENGKKVIIDYESTSNNFELWPNTIFGTTFRSFLEQIYKFRYLTDSFRFDDDELDLTEYMSDPDYDPPDRYEHDNEYAYGGYTIDRRTGYYIILFDYSDD